MNSEILFEAIGGIDDELLFIPKKKKPGRLIPLAAAACLVLIIGAMVKNAAVPAPELTLPIPMPSPMPTETAETPPGFEDGPRRFLTAKYNLAESMVSPDRAYIPGYFTEELSENELEAVLPPAKADGTEYSGYAGFDGEGKLIAVHLTATTPSEPVGISISYHDTARDYLLPGEPEVSKCLGEEFLIYEHASPDGRCLLEAEAEIDEKHFFFSTYAEKEDFEDLIACFARYFTKDGGCDLDVVTADSIPEWFDRKLSYGDALSDDEFGHLFPEIAPAGFAEESIRRYKDYRSDYLSGLWTSGYDYLSWRVRYFEKTDEARLTGVHETENYDLSLYPIPRAQSVPEDKREIVNDPIFDIRELTEDALLRRAYTIEDAGDTDGVRMQFSVRFGEYLVEINSKGVSPQWLYDALISLAL